MGAVSLQPAPTANVDGDPSSERDERELVSKDIAALRDIYGPRWVFVPHGYGEAAVHAREVLEHGLIPIDIDRSDPVRVTTEVGAFARITPCAASRARIEPRSGLILPPPSGGQRYQFGTSNQACREVEPIRSV